MTSLFFCGHLGPNELAGVALANSCVTIGVFSTLNGLSVACNYIFFSLTAKFDLFLILKAIQCFLSYSVAKTRRNLAPCFSKVIYKSETKRKQDIYGFLVKNLDLDYNL